MCHLSIKLSDKFDPNPMYTSDKIVVRHISVKEKLLKLDLEPKCQGLTRNQKTMTRETKNMPPQKNLSRRSLSNWCDADEEADANSSKTICRPQPYGGGIDIQ